MKFVSASNITESNYSKKKKQERNFGDLTELLKNVTESCLQNQVPKRCQVFARNFDYNNKTF
jgi:hypothetical protein